MENGTLKVMNNVQVDKLLGLRAARDYLQRSVDILKQEGNVTHEDLQEHLDDLDRQISEQIRGVKE